MSHRSSIPGCGVTFEIVSNIPEVKDHMKFEFTKNKHVTRANTLRSHLPKKYVSDENVHTYLYILASTDLMVPRLTGSKVLTAFSE